MLAENLQKWEVVSWDDNIPEEEKATAEKYPTLAQEIGGEECVFVLNTKDPTEYYPASEFFYMRNYDSFWTNEE